MSLTQFMCGKKEVPHGGAFLDRVLAELDDRQAQLAGDDLNDVLLFHMPPVDQNLAHHSFPTGLLLAERQDAASCRVAYARIRGACLLPVAP